MSKDKDAKSKIINFYEKIPKSLLDNVENANYELHHLKLPARVVCNSPSGSGKTNWLINLIALFSKGKGTFADITILTRNKDEPLYRWLELKSDSIQIKEGLSNLPDLDKYDKSVNHLLVFDDLVLSKNQDGICEYYIRARKKNVTVVYLSQSYYQIPKIIRQNCNYFVILKMSGARQINMILKEFGLGTTKEQLIGMYNEATAEKFQPLIIDCEADESKRFRKGFIDVMNPADYS
jgi:hypothetical protein